MNMNISRRVLAFQDPADEKTYCVLQPYSPERLFLTLQSLAEETGTSIVVGDAKGRLTIKITAAVHGMTDSGSVEAPFAGGFQIRDKQTKVTYSYLSLRISDIMSGFGRTIIMMLGLLLMILYFLVSRLD